MLHRDLSTLPLNVKQLIEQNPFKTQLDSLQAAHGTTFTDLQSKRREQRSKETALKTVVTKVVALEAKERILKRNIARAEKALETSEFEFNAEFLNPDTITKFFDQIGMKFLSFSFDRNGEYAALRFIRPAKMLGCLPIQPMIVILRYELVDSDTLIFTEAKVCADLEASDYFHPHIDSDGDICLGNFTDVLRAQNVPMLVEGYQDHVLLIDNLLSTFNPGSPYRMVHEIIIDMVNEGMHFEGNRIYLESDSSDYTIVHPKINDARRDYKIKDIITREWYQKYYDMITGIKMIDIIEDIIFVIANCKHDDDESTIYERMVETRDELNNLFEGIVELESVSYITDRDDYRLNYDDLDDVKARWQKQLEEVKNSEKSIKFSDLPSLDNEFSISLEHAVASSAPLTSSGTRIEIPSMLEALGVDDDEFEVSEESHVGYESDFDSDYEPDQHEYDVVDESGPF